MASVLVVDDRADNRELLVSPLRHAGHRVLEASDGPDALETIRTEAPDLVVTDILMPAMGGWEFVRLLRADPDIDQPRVVFSTATYLAGQARELADACGVSHVIEKPPEPEAALKAIDETLREDPPSEVMRAGEGENVDQESFGRVHARLVNKKLLEKVAELEASNRERRQLVADLVKAQEVERARIASDIHDDSIQVMSAVALRLEMLGDDLESGPDGAAVATAAEKVRLAVERLRRLIFDLSPRSLESGGLGGAIEAYLSEVGSESDFRWHVQNELPEQLPYEVEVSLYRIAQEAIRNTQKHAEASNVTVALGRREGDVVMRVVDNGVGFALATSGPEAQPGHLGLRSMRERAAIAGGRLDVVAEPGSGCTIEVRVPDPATPRGPAGRARGEVSQG
ncbi:MAG TPA: response regulator [Thermoleophilaceae bacterium]|jgi:signal transduction histidine kinase